MNEISDSYRALLKIELADRIAHNPRYSLRAMAKQIQVAPSLLSDVIKGNKGISVARAYSIALALKFDPAKCDYFATLVQLETAKAPEHRQALLEKLESFRGASPTRSLDLDLFRTVSDWYHFSILELTHVSGFDFEAGNIAAVLGISKPEAENALDRLLRLELLERTPAGRYRKTDGFLLANSSIPNQALRNYHEQMLKKAIEALSQQTPSEKFVGSETFAFDEDQLKKATEHIEECFTKILKMTHIKKPKKQVYHLGIQLFRVTRKENS
jgi:uncharacterized protein (TIGR02147 family)